MYYVPLVLGTLLASQQALVLCLLILQLMLATAVASTKAEASTVVNTKQLLPKQMLLT